ncbi:hypothetical protein Pint_36503 [Pistacia integerrima]|uniref:Uncharacterized protein n=1 Tax=Pistacia integerrima TaxID=434235 RepID=A0ACC0Y148_9ROSI|nr:hypothetical protein Pint_36503 [Pistacia integerrima]
MLKLMWHKQHHLIILLLMLQSMKVRIWSLKKSRMMRMIRLKKGGLIGLAVATVGLTSEAAYHLECKLLGFLLSNLQRRPSKTMTMARLMEKLENLMFKTWSLKNSGRLIAVTTVGLTSEAAYHLECKLLGFLLSNLQRRPSKTMTMARLMEKLENLMFKTWSLKNSVKLLRLISLLNKWLRFLKPMTKTPVAQILLLSLNGDQDMLFYGLLERCPICNSKLEFDGKRYTCKGMYSEWSTCTFRTKDPPRREEPVKIPDSVLKSVDLDVYFWTIHSSFLQLRLDFDLEVSNDSQMDEKLGFEEDKGSEDNHNQNNTNNVENNNATMDSCGECLSCMLSEKLSWKLQKRVVLLSISSMDALVTQYTWTIKIHQLIRWIKKQNCPSVLGLR